MATLLMSGHTMADTAPAGFQPKFDTALEMTYQIVDGIPLFSYRTAAAEYRDQQMLQRNLAGKRWSPLMTRLEFAASLDLSIADDCRIFLFADVNRPISWSLQTDAILTAADMQDLYYELRYWNGQDGVRRSQFRGDQCKKISFLAKLNPDRDDPRPQKFSYFVRIRDADGRLVEHEIDPDIRNPGGTEP